MPGRRMLITRNRPEEGLGLPLPAGARPAVLADGDGRPLLLGEGVDRATMRSARMSRSTSARRRACTAGRSSSAATQAATIIVLTVTNDQCGADPLTRPSSTSARPTLPRRAAGSPRRNGRPLWAVTVPANGSATPALPRCAGRD